MTVKPSDGSLSGEADPKGEYKNGKGVQKEGI